MVKSKIALLVIAIILYSCQNKVLINELEIVDGKTLYNGKNYSGIAIQKDNPTKSIALLLENEFILRY